MILTAMRGYSALSRGAGNELMPESDSGLTNEIVMILTAMREMEQGVKTATLKEKRQNAPTLKVTKEFSVMMRTMRRRR